MYFFGILRFPAGGGSVWRFNNCSKNQTIVRRFQAASPCGRVRDTTKMLNS